MPDYAAPVTGTFVKVGETSPKPKKKVPMDPMHELVGRVFCTRNEAHLNHWATHSYAEHMALESFYDSILDPLDELVENYQAAYGLIGKDLQEDEENEDLVETILERLKDDVRWINKQRSNICKNVAALENILDTLSSIYLRTIYKLENLS